MRRFALVCTSTAIIAVGLLLAACGGSAVSTSSRTPIPSLSSPSSAAPAVSDPEADLRVKEGAHAIEVGLQSWAVAQDSPHYPKEATAAVLGTYMSDPWPVNPFTGADMKPGTAPGDYAYEVAANGKSCTLTVRLSDGSSYTPQVLRIGG